MEFKEFIKSHSIQEIAEKGDAFYQTIKGNYEPQNNGKFLAIDVERDAAYMGDTSQEATEKAEAANPDTMLYLVKIGFAATDILLSAFNKYRS